MLDEFEYHPTTSFARYINKYMRWEISDWLRLKFDDPLNEAEYELPESYLSTTVEYIHELNPKGITLQMVMSPKRTLLEGLTLVQRYVIYLYLKKEISIMNLVKILGIADQGIDNILHPAIAQMTEAIADEQRSLQ